MINLRHVQIIVKLLHCVQQVKLRGLQLLLLLLLLLLQFVANLFMTLAQVFWRFKLTGEGEAGVFPKRS